MRLYTECRRAVVRLYVALLITGLSLLGNHPLWAGEITLTIPDAQMKPMVDELILWVHGESDANGGHKTDAEKLAWLSEYLQDEEHLGMAVYLAGKLLAEHRYGEFFGRSALRLRYDEL